MLQEEKRKQLDAIVQRMVANKETDENIQAVVADFKKKYAQTTQTESKNKLPLIDRAINTGAKVTDTIFGGGKIGETIGTLGGYAYTKGKDILKGTNVAESYDISQPSASQFVGSGLQSASLFFPGGRAAKIGTQAARYLGMRGASKAIGAIGSGALGGYGFDIATNLQQEKEGADILTPGIGTAIGGAIPAIGAAASGAKKLVVKFGEDQGPRVINSLIKPLLKDFSYGKNPGRAVAEEGIIANNFDDLEKAIKSRRQEVGREIGELGRTISTKPEIQVRESLSVLDDAMKEAASLNNPTLLQRLQQVKRAITDNLVPELDETGNIVIKSAGARNLDNLTFEEARRVLTEIGDMTQFTGNPSDDKLVNSTLKRIYGSIKQATLDNARKTNPELAKRFEELTEKYADLSSAEIATKYRDKILERQNLVGLNPKMTGIASGLVTLVATGGATAPAVLVGIGGAALDNLMSSPGFKTRLAAMLSKKTAGELDTIFSKVPALKKVFPKDEIQFPGDVLFDKVDDAIKDIPNKQGGFVAVPNLGGSADDLVNQAKKYKSAEEFVKAQGTPLYHGSTNKWTGEFRKPTGERGSEGIFLSPSESGAKYYDRSLDGSGEVKSVFVNPKVKLWDYKNPKDVEALSAYIKSTVENTSQRTLKLKLEAQKDAIIQRAKMSEGGMQIRGEDLPKYNEIKQKLSELPDSAYNKSADELIAEIKTGAYETISDPRISSWIKQHYDGFKQMDWYDTGRAESIAIFDPKNVKTSSQLTDIWNKAHSGADDLVNQAKKYKSAEEFVKAYGIGEIPSKDSRLLYHVSENANITELKPQSNGSRGVFVTPGEASRSNGYVYVIDRTKLPEWILKQDPSQARDFYIDKPIPNEAIVAKSKISQGKIETPVKSQLTDIWNKAHESQKEINPAMYQELLAKKDEILNNLHLSEPQKKKAIDALDEVLGLMK